MHYCEPCNSNTFGNTCLKINYENKLFKLHNYQCHFSSRLGQGTDESINYRPMQITE